MIVKLTNDTNKSKQKSLKKYQTTDDSSSSDNDKHYLRKSRESQDSTKITLTKLHSYKHNINDNQKLTRQIFQSNNSSTKNFKDLYQVKSAVEKIVVK